MTLVLERPGRHDLAFYQGGRFREGYSYSVDGVRQDLGNFEVHAQIRTRPGGPIVLDLRPYIDLDLVDGIIYLTVPSDVTRAMTRGGVWDMFLVDENDPIGTQNPLLAGKVSLVKAVTA